EGDTLFVADNEADRLIAEELLPSDAARIVRVPWWIPPAVAAAEDAGSASAVGEVAVAGGLRAARAPMLSAEISRDRTLGRDVARAVTDAVVGGVGPEQSEREAASLVAAGLVSRGIDPLVVLVTG
ncbi:peptidase M24, partial [Pseudomonas sp. BGM005]|nr:peptidase M24 [Pseudomonas sp. BG5]